MTDDLTRKRWKRATMPSQHSPRDAIAAAMAAFDEADVKPDHAIVVFGIHCDDGADGTQFYQAGSYSYHGQQGLLSDAAHMIRGRE